MSHIPVKIAFHTLGCKVNSCETEAIRAGLAAGGFHIVPFDAMADVYIVNTCAVTHVADQKSRKALRRAKRQNPAAVVVALGCLVDAGSEALADLPIDLALGNSQKEELAAILTEYLARREPPPVAAAPIPDAPPSRTRAFIKIQDGCDRFCSYCIVPVLRGQPRSRSAAAIVAEAAELADGGLREIVLTGINIGAYDGGAPQPASDALLELLERLSAIPALTRIRLSSLEPGLISAAFARRVAAMAKVCPHFHLSLQSGADTTLARMNRPYTAAEYLEKVGFLREAYQEARGSGYEAALTTDVIVGFPGESEAEFAATEALLKQVAFAAIHVFPYSRRAGTAAATMAGQVAGDVKKERSRRLISLGETMSAEYRRRFIGHRVRIILEEAEEIDGTAYLLGYTDEYVRAAIAAADIGAGESWPGRLVEATLTREGHACNSPMFAVR